MKTLIFAMLILTPMVISAQTPPIESGVSQELARWRAARYSDVRYKLNLTLEKMSPVVKGTMEVRVRVSGGDGEKGSGGEKPGTQAPSPASPQRGEVAPIILDWRKIKGHDDKSTVSNVSINGKAALVAVPVTTPSAAQKASGIHPSLDKEGSGPFAYAEQNEHLIFRDGVVVGENVIKLDFTSPILPSGSAITRYVDKEDGSEYIYSLFVPSDASTAFPVFDQPDLKARFELEVSAPNDWSVISNGEKRKYGRWGDPGEVARYPKHLTLNDFAPTKPISTYVFAFAVGSWERVAEPPASAGGRNVADRDVGATDGRGDGLAGRTISPGAVPPAYAGGSAIYVRKSQAAKFKPHAAEVFRLNREAVKYFEQYFDYKFPFPKYDLVLVPEFPFGGMEHAGATFLRESAIIFPQEPTRNDLVSRATLIFHEAAHQWFGDTVTMRWFDDLWLKEGFATFTAYKALEKIIPETNAWKVFYERIKQGAYQTDSTKGTTAIYQPVANLSAAKSAYGNIVYNKAPAFLRQAEFYLGEDKFQTAVRAFLKKNEFGNAGWEDLVREFETSTKQDLKDWAETWVKKRGLPVVRIYMSNMGGAFASFAVGQSCYCPDGHTVDWKLKTKVLIVADEKSLKDNGWVITEKKIIQDWVSGQKDHLNWDKPIFYDRYGDSSLRAQVFFPNYQDYGYGIFLLDDYSSRDYVIKNIQNEMDPFLRAMMWGALWDSVREGEMDPRVFVELVVRNLSTTPSGTTPTSQSLGHPSSNQEGSAAATPPETGGESEMRKPAREQGLNEQRSDYALNEQHPDYALANAQSSATDDESTVQMLLSRVSVAMSYYIPAPDIGLTNARALASVSEPGAVATGLRKDDGSKRPVATAPGSDKNDLQTRVEDMLIEWMGAAPSLGQRITYYRAFLNVAASEKARGVLKGLLRESVPPAVAGGDRAPAAKAPPTTVSGTDKSIPIKTKDKFDIATRLLILGDREAPKLLADLEKTETSDDAKRYAYAAKAGIGTAENKAKYWNDFVNNKEISESWIEAAFGPWNSIRHSELTLPYLQKALQELPNHKRNRKIFFVNGWLGAFIGGQRSEEALGVVNKFLTDNPKLDNDLRLKILENVDVIERAVRIRQKHDR